MGALNRRPKKPLTTIIKAHLLPSIWLVVRSKKDFVYPDTVFQFPRADIFLHPDDLEPTPELKKAIERIARFKNVNDLRKLYQDFGQLFCKQVTVGGRLQSTKIMKQSSAESEQDQKEQFKVSVGLQVSTPIGVGAGVKHEQEKGKSSSVNTTTVDKGENNVFEAVGGNTILAAK